VIKNEPLDGNKEMIAFGLMNIFGSFTSCYVTTGKLFTVFLPPPQGKKLFVDFA